jgi:ubiquinone/menaquinone biosynthesis C-methylase UbiE
MTASVRSRPETLSEISKKLEIDEDGYPIFGGLRLHDEDVLGEVFSNLQRILVGEMRSKLVTCVDGTWAWIDAFDAPLVAQSAKLRSDSVVELEFLGGRSFEVPLNTLEVDEWDRFHASVGDAAIPAVLSRKAQAAFLNAYSQLRPIPGHEFRRFRSPLNAPAKAEFWSEAYRNKQDGWELAASHPRLKEREWIAFEDSKILIPGAGRGHDAAFFAETLPRARVVALDFAPEAKRDALALHPGHSNLIYETNDVFAFLKAQPDHSLDMVFEHTFFCAIDPLQRSHYIKELARVLKPAAPWIGIFFLLEHDGGPPYALTQWELREFTRKDFDIRAWERIVESPQGRGHKELWAEFYRRSTEV